MIFTEIGGEGAEEKQIGIKSEPRTRLKWNFKCGNDDAHFYRLEINTLRL